jgi:hypothetical protein
MYVSGHSSGCKRAVLASGVLVAAIAAPIALAAGSGSRTGAGVNDSRARANAHTAASEAPVRGGIHNPPRGTYSRTTGVFANNNTWAARISNLGSGGAVIDGCRSPSEGPSCVRVENLAGGLAFAFKSTGSKGGELLLGNVNGAPFTTNAHGVATGLNANFLQGRQASEFQLAGQSAPNAEQLGGQPPQHYVNTQQLLFADVGAGPSIQNTSSPGASSVSQSVTSTSNAYTVSFGSLNISKCAFTASPQGAALTSGALGVEASPSDPSAVIINAPAEFKAGFDLQVVCA